MHRKNARLRGFEARLFLVEILQNPIRGYSDLYLLILLLRLLSRESCRGASAQYPLTMHFDEFAPLRLRECHSGWLSAGFGRPSPRRSVVHWCWSSLRSCVLRELCVVCPGSHRRRIERWHGGRTRTEVHQCTTLTVNRSGDVFVVRRALSPYTSSSCMIHRQSILVPCLTLLVRRLRRSSPSMAESDESCRNQSSS